MVATLRTTAIKDVAPAFLDLDEARHDADYDHVAPFDKATVLEHVRVAERAIATLAGATQQDRQTLMALLALKRQLR